MFTRLTLTRFDFYSLCKLLFTGFVCFFVPFGLIVGVLAVFGLNTVTWNQQSVHGLAGLAAGLGMGIVFTLMLTVFAGIPCAIGLWLYSKFKPLSIWGKEIVHYPADAA
jgi:hypothetical protein